MTTAKITVVGVREFQRALKDMDAGLPKMLRIVHNEAGGLIVDYARPRIPSRSGRARGSLKLRSSQREGRVAIGGNRAAWVPWLDFGGEGRRKGRPPARPFLTSGRYVYRALEVKRQQVTDIMAAGYAGLARDAGLDVS
jgi:hypothetical protein